MKHLRQVQLIDHKDLKEKTNASKQEVIISEEQESLEAITITRTKKLF